MIQIPRIFSDSDVTERLSSAGSPDERSLHLQTGMGINIFIFNEIIILFISALHGVTRFEGQGRKDEEVRGDEPEKGCLITQNKQQ